MPKPEEYEELEIDFDAGDSLTEIAETLASEGINIRGFMTYTEGDQGKACLVTSDPKKARKALKTAGFQAQTRESLMVPAPNKPGAFADIAQRLDKQGVKIHRSFVTTDEAGDRPGIGLHVDDPAKARKVLGN